MGGNEGLKFENLSEGLADARHGLAINAGQGSLDKALIVDRSRLIDQEVRIPT